MPKPFNPFRQTLINILMLPLMVGVCAGGSYVILSLGSDTPHEASFGDVGEAFLFIIAFIGAAFFWLAWMAASIIKHSDHRGFLFANIFIVLSPFFLIAGYKFLDVWNDNKAVGSIKDAMVPVNCKERQLFYGPEHIVGIHRSADTVYFVTGIGDGTKADSGFSFKYNDTMWTGSVEIKQTSPEMLNKNNIFLASLGSLRYYAFYHDSLYANIDKRAVVDTEYKLGVVQHETKNAKSGQPLYHNEWQWQVAIKAEKRGCKYLAFNYTDDDHPTIYVKDTTCGPTSVATYPKLHGYSDASVWQQLWQRTLNDKDENLYMQVKPSIMLPGDEHRQDSIQIAHFSRNQVRVYNLNAAVHAQHAYEAHMPFHSLFRQGDKLYIVTHQKLIYFNIPKL